MYFFPPLRGGWIFLGLSRREAAGVYMSFYHTRAFSTRFSGKSVEKQAGNILFYEEKSPPPEGRGKT
jgi:hypothetical protein